MSKTEKQELQEIVTELKAILQDTLEVLTPEAAIPAKKPATPDASNPRGKANDK